MVQAARDALVAVRVVGVKVHAGPADDTGVQFRGIKDRLLVRIDDTRLGGTVGVDEVGVLISLIALAVLVAIAQRGLQILQRGHELAVTFELALALFVGRLNRIADLGDGHGIGLRDDQRDGILRGAATQRGLGLIDVQIGHDGALAGDNLRGILHSVCHFILPP